MKECKIRQYGDTVTCHECGLCWDINDKNPPNCNEESRYGWNLGQKIESLAFFLMACVKLTGVIAVIYFGVSAWMLLKSM